MFVDFDYGELQERCEKAIFCLSGLEGDSYAHQVKFIADILYAQIASENQGFEEGDVVSISDGTGMLLIGEEREDIASFLSEAEKVKTENTVEEFFDVWRDVFAITEVSE